MTSAPSSCISRPRSREPRSRSSGWTAHQSRPSTTATATATTHQHEHDHEHPQGHEHGDATHTHGRPHRPHVAVVGRPVGDHTDYSAVFPTLTEGSYALFVPGAASPVLVEVRGGEVSEADWPGDGGSA